MIERALLALALLALLVAALAAARVALRWRDRRIARRLRAASRATERGPGAPRVVYFTTESCAICRAEQEPALEALRAQLPDVVIERHDALEERGLAHEYGVITVPTTAVYDREGQLVTINRGSTPAARLRTQIEHSTPGAGPGVRVSEPVGS